MEGDRNDPLYKVVLVGDVGVGKTSIFHRYDRDKFLDYRDSTIGMDKLNKDVTVDGHRCKINVWDTAGMERTRSLTSNYYRNAHVVIFVYAIDDMYSLTVLRNWVADVEKDAKTALKVLVGNKTDLADEGSQVDKQQAQSFCKNNRLDVAYQVSAKTGAGVKEMFDNIAKLLLRNKEHVAIQKTDAFALIEAESEKGSEKSSSGCSC